MHSPERGELFFAETLVDLLDLERVDFGAVRLIVDLTGSVPSLMQALDQPRRDQCHLLQGSS
jgi:hypothetical protein